MFFRKLYILLTFTLLASCANTSLITNWKGDHAAHTYKHLLVIGISDSQQTRRLYENYFASVLKKNNIIAVPSYTLISSKQKITREVVVDAIKGTEIDSVLVTYLVSANTEMKHRESPFNTGYSGYSDSVDDRISATIITNRGQSRDEEIFVLKSDLFGVAERDLVWSAQTKTVGPESIDEVIVEVTELLVKTMIDDGILQ